MLRFNSIASSHLCRAVCLFLSYTLIFSFFATSNLRQASGQVPALPTPSPQIFPSPLSITSGNPLLTPPPPVIGARGGPTGGFMVAPPHPPSGLLAVNLPNIAALRNENIPPKIESAILSQAPIQYQPYCDDECGGSNRHGNAQNNRDPDFSTARTQPHNETGLSEVTLGSQNFNWSLPLVFLPGRSGMDLGITLTYNSLVWTLDGNSIRFNADRGFPGPAPGFHLGFPTLQQRFYDSLVGVYAYMLVTSSGGRVELREVGTSNIYESADGSHTQLTDYGNSALVRTTDGMQYTFIPWGTAADNEYRCTQIEDRNGNLINATYNSLGRLVTIIDTLGRSVNFNYDALNYLTSISQAWTVNGQQQTQVWASFGYGDLLVQTNFPLLDVDGPNNQTIPVLTEVMLPDGSNYNFDYTSWGQVYQIRLNAADGHERAHIFYNLPQDSSQAQTDCPRFTERHDWAEYWTEAVTYYNVDPNGAWSEEIAPDGTRYRENYGSGWQKGLPTEVDYYDSSGARVKWVTTQWTQDDVNVSYPMNPRPMEINIYDSNGNHRRTTYGYTDPTAYGLLMDTTEYAADASTVLRRKHTDYVTDSTYINRRLIALPVASYVYDGGGNLFSKVDYLYDQNAVQNPGAMTQHDDSNYGAGFVQGRGNVTSIRRWNVNSPNDAAQVLVSSVAYNTAGSVISTTDPAGHQSSIGYEDSFLDGANRNTFAYPTTVTDADNNSSTVQYSYDFGAITFTRDPKGARTIREYDGIGRPLKFTNIETGAYTRWEYPSSQNTVNQFSTIQENAGEAFSTEVMDGAGRVYTAASLLPGSIGGYSAQRFLYDSMGRLQWESNPAETTASWTPIGDDLQAGWQWTEQAYDWKGRPTLTTNSDGSTRENVYGGCGCAGGEVVNARDEAGRIRRLTMDVVGRLKTVEELNWYGNVYSTTNYTYNALDQLTQMNQQGQVRSMDYDGYGRVWHRTTPEQGTTTYSYYADDTVQMITDARGASQTFSYNGRHLVTGISYGVPAGVAATPNVAFGYDSAGNRRWMTDGMGRVDYVYDTVSRVTSETRQFSEIGASYTLTYEYNLSGELTSMTYPWGAQVGYSYDQVGRVISVSGANYAGVSSYVNNISYRAFGGVKQINYGNTRQLNLDYNNRLFLSKWDVSGVLGYTYDYNQYGENNTGRVTFAHSIYDSTLDRSYYYDHVGRLTYAYTGSEARATIGTDTWGHPDGPYAHAYGYDVWGNRTHREGWGGSFGSYVNDNPTFTRNQMDSIPYDAAGNVTTSRGITYDATGQQASYVAAGTYQFYDGDRLRVKKTDNSGTIYYLRSSVLGGQVVCEIASTGSWLRGYVYLGTQLLAIQAGGINWVHQDPVSKGQRLTDVNGAISTVIELDPWGVDTWRSSNQAFQPHRFTSYERDSDNGDEAMMRRYASFWAKFFQPDPYDGSYNLTDPQSFNRYSYVQNDPVNFTDPSGLDGDGGVGFPINCDANGVCTFSNLPGGTAFSGNGVMDSGGLFGGGGGSGAGDMFIPQIDEGAGVGFDMGGGQQNGRSQEFIDCANNAGLGWMLSNSNFNDESSAFVNRVAHAEGINAGLLGFTFQHEGGFNINAGPNPNHQQDHHLWDWGPFQLNYNQTIADTNAGSYSMEGLDIHSVFGDLNLFGSSSTPLDPFQNGRLAARKLNYLLGASNNNYATAAGRYRRWTGAEFTGRRDEWNREGQQFQNFFNCFTRT